MQYLLEGILSDVRIALDENEMTADLIRDINTLSLNDIIRQKVVDAVRTVSLNASADLMGDAPSIASEITWRGNVATLPLPDDFLRLVIFKIVIGPFRCWLPSPTLHPPICSCSANGPVCEAMTSGRLSPSCNPPKDTDWRPTAQKMKPPRLKWPNTTRYRRSKRTKSPSASYSIRQSSTRRQD